MRKEISKGDVRPSLFSAMSLKLPIFFIVDRMFCSWDDAYEKADFLVGKSIRKYSMGKHRTFHGFFGYIDESRIITFPINILKVSKSLTFFALLLVFFTQAALPSLAVSKAPVPGKSFEELRLEVLEVDLSSFGRSLSPYQLWLIHYWRGEYVMLLNVDTFAATYESWKQRGSKVAVDLSDMFNDSRDIYFRDLVTMIQNTDLVLNEKEFLELFLIYILNQGEERFRSHYQLNALVDSYLSKYPDSPFRQFVQSYIQVDIPPLLWSIGFSSMFLAAIPQGSISDYFSGHWGMTLGFPVSYRNIVLTPSIGIVTGDIKTRFYYNDRYWDGRFEALTLDLSLGYRVKLFQHFAILPQCGLGLLKILWDTPREEGEEDEFGFTPTASLGIVFEYFFFEK